MRLKVDIAPQYEMLVLGTGAALIVTMFVCFAMIWRSASEALSKAPAGDPSSRRAEINAVLFGSAFLRRNRLAIGGFFAAGAAFAAFCVTMIALFGERVE
jgi:hypothetical protein